MKTMLAAVMAAILGGSSASAQGQPPEAGRLESVLDDQAARYPGLAFAVVDTGGKLRAGAAGQAAGGVAFSAQTPVALYSVAKPMTATLALSLAAEGKLDLDRPIGEVVSVPPPWQATTPRRLLSHTSGMRHYRRGEWIPLSRHHCATTGDALSDFINDPAGGAEGHYLYSTFGYVLLSHVLATAAKQDFGDLFEARIAQPSGGHLKLWRDGLAPPPNGFEAQGGGFRPVRAIDNSCKFGAGGVTGSAEDLARFGQALVSGKIIPVDLARTMATPTNGEGSYGLGWALSALGDGTPVATHSGSAIGGTSAIAVDLRRGTVAAVTGNAEGPSLVPSAKRLLELVAQPDGNSVGVAPQRW